MNVGRRNLVVGVLVGLFIAGVIFYFNSTINEQAPPFLVGFLTCFTLLCCLLILGGIWFQKKIKQGIFGNLPSENEDQNSFQSTVKSILGHVMPGNNQKEINAGVQVIQSFIWGRMVYSFLGVVVSVFLVLGGLLGSILIFNQNELIDRQNNLITTQNQKLDRQNDLFSDQNVAVETQTELMRSQDSLFNVQTELVQQNIIEVVTQSRLLDQQTFFSQVELATSHPFLIDLIKSEVQQELQNSNIKNTRLSSTTIGKIIALSLAVDPGEYKSVERGDLLMTFVKRNLAQDTYKQIYKFSDFSLAQLSGQDLRNGIFKGAYLALADLTEADLSGADLRKVNLRDASLLRTIVRGADFTGANLTEANLSGADLSGADLSGADLSDASLSEADLNFADFSGTNLTRANLSGAKINPQTLQFATLDQIDLPGFDLSGLKLKGIDLSSSDLHSANLHGVDLSGNNLYQANLNQANLAQINLKNANLRGADLREAIFINGNLSGANLGYADLSDADLRDADLSDADLREANLSGARNLAYEQLIKTNSLYEAEGLSLDLKRRLEKEKPCLFEDPYGSKACKQ